MSAEPACKVFYRTPGRTPPTIERAESIYLWDRDGKRYLDAASGALVANIGHGRTEVAEAAMRQMATVDFIHGGAFTSGALEALAERVGTWLPPERWRFYAVSGGSEATESAIKLARQYHVERGNPEKRVVISRWSSYHGASLGALAVSGMGARRRLYEPLLRSEAFAKISRPNPKRDGREDAAELETVIHDLGPENVAAFFAEPIVGAAAPALAPGPGYYEEVRRICTEHDVLYVSDEVMTGFGRTGTRMALDRWSAVPDIVVLGKGMGAGYVPLAGMAVRQAIVDAIAMGSGAFTHGYTYAGHPVSAAVGVAVLDILEREGLVQRSAEMGTHLLARLREIARGFPEVAEVRGYGLMLGVVLQDPSVGGPFAKPGYALEIGRAALGLGLNVYPGTGSGPDPRGDHVLLGPPLTIERAQVDDLAAMFHDALAAARTEADKYRTG